MFNDIKNKLLKKFLGSNKLTSNYKFIDELSKKSIKYNDDFYIPFFYYLGQYIKPKRFLEIGLNLAIYSGCFLKSCKTVEYFLGFQQKNDKYFNFNIPKSNLKINYKNNLEFYHGDFFDYDFQELINKKKFELIIINQEYSYDKFFEICETIYSNNLEKEGLMIFSDISKKDNLDIFNNMSKGYNLNFENIYNKIGVLIK
jgi:hypothetical protein